MPFGDRAADGAPLGDFPAIAWPVGTRGDRNVQFRDAAGDAIDTTGWAVVLHCRVLRGVRASSSDPPIAGAVEIATPAGAGAPSIAVVDAAQGHWRLSIPADVWPADLPPVLPDPAPFTVVQALVQRGADDATASRLVIPLTALVFRHGVPLDLDPTP